MYLVFLPNPITIRDIRYLILVVRLDDIEKLISEGEFIVIYNGKRK